MEDPLTLSPSPPSPPKSKQKNIYLPSINYLSSFFFGIRSILNKNAFFFGTSLSPTLSSMPSIFLDYSFLFFWDGQHVVGEKGKIMDFIRKSILTSYFACVSHHIKRRKAKWQCPRNGGLKLFAFPPKCRISFSATKWQCPRNGVLKLCFSVKVQVSFEKLSK